MIMQILPMLSGGSGGGGVPGMGQVGKMGSSVLDMVRMIRAARELRELNETPRPNYEISPELQQSYNRAEQRAQMGFTPTQTQAFNQNLAGTLNADFANARNMAGGGLAQALTSRLMGQRLNALNRFASDDAAMQARNIAAADQQAGRMQSQRNLATGANINYRMNDERALGQAVQDNYMNFRNQLAGEAAMQSGYGGGYGGSGFGMGGFGGGNVPQGYNTNAMKSAASKAMQTPLPDYGMGNIG